MPGPLCGDHLEGGFSDDKPWRLPLSSGLWAHGCAMPHSAGHSGPRRRSSPDRTSPIGTGTSRLSLSRFEAHFNFGAHFDGVAALDWGLITELRPRHTLTELRAGFEVGDLPLLVDNDFAANRSPLGLPKGCGLNGRSLTQKSALFIRRNRDFGDVLVLRRGVFLRRGIRCNGP